MGPDMRNRVRQPEFLQRDTLCSATFHREEAVAQFPDVQGHGNGEGVYGRCQRKGQHDRVPVDAAMAQYPDLVRLLRPVRSGERPQLETMVESALRDGIDIRLARFKIPITRENNVLDLRILKSLVADPLQGFRKFDMPDLGAIESILADDLHAIRNHETLLAGIGQGVRDLVQNVVEDPVILAIQGHQVGAILENARDSPKNVATHLRDALGHRNARKRRPVVETAPPQQFNAAEILEFIEAEQLRPPCQVGTKRQRQRFIAVDLRCFKIGNLIVFVRIDPYRFKQRLLHTQTFE